MKHIWILALLVCFSGCATVSPVPGSIDQESANYVTVCSSCEIEKNCSFFSPSRATKKIAIDGFDVKVGGSENGEVVFVGDAKIIGNRIKDCFKLKFNSPSHSETANQGCIVVKDALEKEGIQVQKIRPVRSFGNIDGYLLELDKDGYSVLVSKYEIKK